MHQKVEAFLKRITRKHMIAALIITAACSLTLVGAGLGAAAAQPKLIDGWVLSVDGQAVAGAATEAELQTAYDALVASYETEDTLSTQVMNQVELTQGEYSVALPQGDAIAAALAQSVTVRTEYREVLVEVVAMETVVVEDDSMYLDESVTEEGHDGEQVTETTVVCLNGEEFLRKQEPTRVTLEMEPTVITNGTQERPEYIWPCSGGVITSYFGRRSSPTAGASSDHKGIDIGISHGSPIYAIRQGTVTEASYNATRGYYVEVTHDNGVVSIYMHCSKLLVSEGDTVAQGERIANVGSTGVSTGSHLHLSIVVNGVNKNPLNYIG